MALSYGIRIDYKGLLVKSNRVNLGLGLDID